MATKLTFDIEADELEIFLDEVNEHMQVMESGILNLEQGANLDILNGVFRAAHTIKALAGTVGHTRMAELTHTMENLFDAMRNGAMKPNQALVDELLAVVDVLKALRDEIATQTASGLDVAPVLARLKAIAQGENAAPAAVAKSEAAAEQHVLLPEQLAEIARSQQAGKLVLEIEVTTTPETFAAAARLMQAAMAAAEGGEVLVQQPTMEDLANSRHEHRLWLVLVTGRSAPNIEHLVSSVSELATVRVQPLTTPDPVGAKASPAAKPAAPAANNEIGADKTVRISIERLDALMNLVGELVTNRNRLQRVEDNLRMQYGKADEVAELSESSADLARVVDQLQEEVMRARMLPISSLFDKFPRIVRDVARASGKQINLVVDGATTELDRSLIEVIGDPLIHLLRNAVDHGIETPAEREAAGKSATGTVKLAAAHVEGHVVITIADDGNGIDTARVRRSAVKRGMITEEHAAQMSEDEAIDLIFLPNLSTAEKLTDISGRGVGMDVVRTNVERLSGSIFVESQMGKGTTFRVTLPLTLAIIETMLVELYHAVYAIPLTSINDVLYLADQEVSTIVTHRAIQWRASVLPLIDLRYFFTDLRFSNGVGPDPHRQAVVSVAWGKQQAGLVVDRIIGKQGIVVKTLSPMIGEVPGISGATILGDGRIALILDIPSLVNATLRQRRQTVGV